MHRVQLVLRTGHNFSTEKNNITEVLCNSTSCVILLTKIHDKLPTGTCIGYVRCVVELPRTISLRQLSMDNRKIPFIHSLILSGGNCPVMARCGLHNKVNVFAKSHCNCEQWSLYSAITSMTLHWTCEILACNRISLGCTVAHAFNKLYACTVCVPFWCRKT